MILKEYFDAHHGMGVLATADANGKVDAAVYSTPHCMDDGSLAFIMRDRLTHENLKSNPYAAFLFIESGSSGQGIRLFLKKVHEDTNEKIISQMTRRNLTPEEDKEKGPKFMVYFSVENILPLIGSGHTPVKAC